MKDVPDYLEGLPHLSPVDQQAIPSGARRVQRAPWMTRREKMIVFGFGLKTI